MVNKGRPNDTLTLATHITQTYKKNISGEISALFDNEGHCLLIYVSET